MLSDPDERETGAAYPIYNFPTHNFIDRDGVIPSIVLEVMDTGEANRLFEESPADAESDVAG